MTTDSPRITPLLAGMDTVYFSCDLPLSGAMRGRLTQEKSVAQARAAQRQVHCPEWLEARIAPQGAKGGYAFLIETEDFSVKLLGEHIQNRPSVFIEMRSYALDTHPEGAAGACEAALAWVRSHLYADQVVAAKGAISFSAAKISRADIHIDWQGGYAPVLSNLSEELRCFIRPGRVKRRALLPRRSSHRHPIWPQPGGGSTLQQNAGNQGEGERGLCRAPHCSLWRCIQSRTRHVAAGV